MTLAAEAAQTTADVADITDPTAQDAPPTGRRWSDGADASQPADPNVPWTMGQQWPNLVASLSEQAVESSNLMLRALNYLVGAGRLRRAEAKPLSDAMHTLRGTSLRAQQITRLAGGRIRQARERVEMAVMIQRMLQERAAEFEAAGASVRAEVRAVDVLLDPPVAISLLNSIVDWGLSFSKELVIQMAPPQAAGPARLRVRVTTPKRAPVAPLRTGGWNMRPHGRRLNDGLHWMLMRQMATSAGLLVTRSGEDGVAILTVEFPQTFLDTEGVSCLELEATNDGSHRDAWVLVLAHDDQVRQQAMDSLRKMGIDAVAARDFAQARTAVIASRPHVVVASYDIDRDALMDFHTERLGGEARCRLVEITKELPTFNLSGVDHFETPKVGREQIAQELPPTVLFELVKIG
jgi:hypothetical protein